MLSVLSTKNVELTKKNIKLTKQNEILVDELNYQKGKVKALVKVISSIADMLNLEKPNGPITDCQIMVKKKIKDLSKERDIYKSERDTYEKVCINLEKENSTLELLLAKNMSKEKVKVNCTKK